MSNRKGDDNNGEEILANSLKNSASATSRSHRQYGENGGLSSKLTLVVSKFILRMDIAAEH